MVNRSAYNSAVGTLAMLADEVIFLQQLVRNQRDEDDVRWAAATAEDVADRAELYAREQWAVINNKSE